MYYYLLQYHYCFLCNTMVKAKPLEHPPNLSITLDLVNTNICVLALKNKNKVYFNLPYYITTNLEMLQVFFILRKPPYSKKEYGGICSRKLFNHSCVKQDIICSVNIECFAINVELCGLR